MTVSTTASIAAALVRVTTAQDTKPAIVLKSLVAATPNSSTVEADNAADVSLQSQIAQFRVVSQSIAASNSALATISAGGADISRELGALRDLAAKAANLPLSDRERAQIDAEFQAIRSRINTIAATTKFGDDHLLDGSTNASGATANLTDKALFQASNPNLLTVASSQVAVDQVAQAQVYTSQQLAALDALQNGLDYASSTVQIALQNQEASQSTLDDADFEVATTTRSGVALQPDIQAQVAQTTRLPSNLLALLSE